MNTIMWDGTGQKLWETGVDHGVLYKPVAGVYSNGWAWNGLTKITESPSGAESNKQYADNIEYANILSAETFGFTIEAFMYPPQFEECDGAITVNGVTVTGQTRKSFGLSYRTLVGNDTDGQDHGEKIHLVYGALAAPSEKERDTINDSPALTALSWECSTTAVGIGTVDGVDFKPAAHLVIDKNSTDPDAYATLLEFLYGTASVNPRLPLPFEVLTLVGGTITEVTTVAPTYNSSTHVITIPTVTGVIYMIDGEVATGTVTITKTTVVNAIPAPGYKFSVGSDDDWSFQYS